MNGIIPAPIAALNWRIIGLLTDQAFRWLGRVAFPWLKR